MAKPTEGSIKRRVTGVLLAFALLLGVTFALVAQLTFEEAVTHLIRWHMEPVMRLLSEAEMRSQNADASSADAFDGAALAGALGVRFYAGEDIPADLRGMEPGLRELEGTEEETYILISRSAAGEEYVLVGEIAAFEELEHVILWILGGAVAACMVAAVVVGLVLSHGLVAPLLELSRRVRAGTLSSDVPLVRRKDEIGFLARTFAEHERELREFLAREQLFTGDVSHELRTPLTVMRGAVELLEVRLEARDEVWPEVARMKRTVASMTEVVQTLLLLARKSDALEIKPLDMAGIIRHEMERAQGGLQGRPVFLAAEYEEQPVMQGNPELAAIIVRNLLENACRYTEDGDIRLSLSKTKFCIFDTGSTIPLEVRERMFERGERGHAGSPGCGLGLSIVQRSCERMNWTVSYQERFPKGNMFTIKFNMPSQ